MSAYQRFSMLAEVAERIRPADRAEWSRQLDDAAAAAMEDAQERRGWSGAAEVYGEWIAVRRPVTRDESLSHLPPRVAAALGSSYYAALQEESSQ